MQLALFPTRPDWWTDADTEIVSEYHRQERRTDCPDLSSGGIDDPVLAAAWERWVKTWHPRLSEYRCRQCSHWASHDGVEGLCLGRFVWAYTEDQRAEPPSRLDIEQDLVMDPPQVCDYLTSGHRVCEEWGPRP